MSGLRFDIEIPTCREGVFVPCGFAEPDDVIECVKLAERLGYVLAEGELLLANTHESAASAYRASRFGQYRASRGLDLDRQIAGNWVGTPESVAAKIGAVADQGIDHFNVLHIVGDTLEARFEQMQMFMEDVVPRLG